MFLIVAYYLSFVKFYVNNVFIYSTDYTLQNVSLNEVIKMANKVTNGILSALNVY